MSFLISSPLSTCMVPYTDLVEHGAIDFEPVVFSPLPPFSIETFVSELSVNKKGQICPLGKPKNHKKKKKKK